MMKVFDAHFHIIDNRYPLIENNGFLPEAFTTEDYEQAVSAFELIGGAIVSGSFQGFDQEYLKASLSHFGDAFFGVANISLDITKEELDLLNDKNVVAVRFNLKRGGSESIDNMAYLSNLLYEKYGWHTELYLDSQHLAELDNILQQIKCFSIDHLGLSKKGLRELYQWVEKGVKVKATGFGRVDFDPIEVMTRINKINPHALMFGTDLPSTRANVAFSSADVEKIRACFDPEDQERIFYKNALAWYQK